VEQKIFPLVAEQEKSSVVLFAGAGQVSEVFSNTPSHL
jgi:hypothetical protein